MAMSLELRFTVNGCSMSREQRDSTLVIGTLCCIFCINNSHFQNISAFFQDPFVFECQQYYFFSLPLLFVSLQTLPSLIYFQRYLKYIQSILGIIFLWQQQSQLQSFCDQMNMCSGMHTNILIHTNIYLTAELPYCSLFVLW